MIKNKIKGYMGAAMLPGSEVIWDRDAGVVANCTLFTCPYGLNGTSEAIVLMQAQEVGAQE